MSSFGVTSSGFKRKLFADLEEELSAAQKAVFGDDFNTEADSVAGQLNGVVGDKLAELWEVAQAIYSAFDPDAAEGAALDNLGKITGAFRLTATSTRVTVKIFSTLGTTVATGDTIEAADGTVYEAIADVTIGAATSEDVVYDAQDTGSKTALAGSVYKNPSTAAVDSIDGSVTSTATEPFDLSSPRSLTAVVGGQAAQTISISGTGSETAASVASKILAELTGALVTSGAGAVLISVDTSNTVNTRNSIQITSSDAEIAFPSTLNFGFPANQTDGVVGRDLETDAEFRLRRTELLQLSATATVEALRDAVDSVTSTTNVKVYENATAIDLTGSGGLPPHSFEVVVTGGDTNDIATAIFNEKPVGILSYSGATGPEKITETVVDSEGVDQTIEFSRPTDFPITDLDVTVVTDSNAFGAGDPAAGTNDIKTTLTAFVDSLTPGDDIIYNQLLCAILDVTGVEDITSFTYDVGGGPISTNTTVGDRDLASLDSSVIDVTVT